MRRENGTLTGSIKSESPKYILDINGQSSLSPLLQELDSFGTVYVEVLVIRDAFAGYRVRLVSRIT